MMRSHSGLSVRGSSSPPAGFAQYPIRRKPEEAADGGKRAALGDRREARPGQRFRETLQIESAGFREVQAVRADQTVDVAQVDALSQRAPLAADPELDYVGVGQPGGGDARADGLHNCTYVALAHVDTFAQKRAESQ
jgi:hypothetical protein